MCKDTQVAEINTSAAAAALLKTAWICRVL